MTTGFQSKAEGSAEEYPGSASRIWTDIDLDKEGRVYYGNMSQMQIARLDPKTEEGVRQALGPIMDLAIGGADDGALDGAGHHLHAPMPVAGVIEDLVDRQRPVLHQAKHAHILPFPPARGRPRVDRLGPAC